MALHSPLRPAFGDGPSGDASLTMRPSRAGRFQHDSFAGIGVGAFATACAWGIGLALTALVVLRPESLLAPQNTTMRIVLATANACIAMLAAYLLHGRYRRSALHTDLLLAQSLLLLGLSALGLTVLTTTDDVGASGWLVWLPEVVRAIGAALVVAAALLQGRRVERFTTRWRTVLIPAVAVLATMGVLAVLRPPAGQTSAVEAPLPRLILEAFSASALLVASVLFARNSRLVQTPILTWLGAAFALLGFARINSLLFPAQIDQWLFAGDLLRAGCYGVLAWAALRELQQYWGAQARAAVLDDRRRMARELHDGVVQELGFIRAEAHGLPDALPSAARILDAADRALDESRAALQALGRVRDESLEVVLRQAALDVADRYGVAVELDLDHTVSADREQRHALMRILREAVSNAARRGRARRIFVRLDRNDDRYLLRIEDDGSGFDVDAALAEGRGYGLVSMRDRAIALPGELAIVSTPGTGTVVMIKW